MSKNLIFCLITFFSISATYPQEIQYPFLGTKDNRDIQAYWYNVPRASVDMESEKIGTQNLQSAIHIYGRAPDDTFKVEVKAYQKNGKMMHEENFPIKKTVKYKNIEFKNGFFKIIHPVEYRKERPDKITVNIQSSKGKRKKEIKCRYHKLQGKITDFDQNPLAGHINICPDAFAGAQLGVLTDPEGNYEIYLPERTYNAIIANKESYGVSTLEAWGWHIIMDSDQQLDFKIGTGEVYNLNVWANNGGGWNYFVSFRPMSLAHAKTQRNFPLTMNGKKFQIKEYSPELDMEDIRIKINGNEAQIISLQKYFETGRPASGCLAYLAQVKRTREMGLTGKQTIELTFQKKETINGLEVETISMGYFQFYLNINGLSRYN